MTTKPTDPPPLSPSGQDRRDDILSLAQRALRARVRRRIIARTALTSVPLAVAIAAAAALTRQQPTPAPIARRDAGASADPHAPAPAHATRIEFVHSDPGILQRTALVALPTRTEFLDDRALVDALAQAGVPAGVIRTPDRVTIAPIVRSASLPPPPSAGDPGALPAAPTG